MLPLQKIKLAWYVTMCGLILQISCTNSVTDGGTETGNPVIIGKLCDMGGCPASGVAVKIYSVNYLPSDVNTDTTFYTNSKGEYVIPLPDSGIYNIIGHSYNKSIFIDSVMVKDTFDVEVPTDTIKLSGGIKGISYLVGQNDTNQIRVTLYIPGTNYLTKPHIGGLFSIPKVPEGTYALFFDPTDPDYFVKIIEVTVTAGQITDLDTIILYSKNINGIPLIDLGNDTTVSINDTIKIDGAASDPYGSIVSMEWGIGGSAFIPTSSPDTVFIAPPIENLNYHCILKVIDNDNNCAYDTIIAHVKTDPPVAVIKAPDTALINSKVTLNSNSSTPGDFGQIIKYEWSIGEYNNFKETSINDTIVFTDSTETDSFIVVLRVADDDGNIDCDTEFIAVKRFWIQVGTNGFSDGKAQYVSIALDNNGVPYVAFRDDANGGKSTLVKYNSIAWESVGNKGFSDGTVRYVSLAIDVNNIPYVAYSDGANGSKTTVMKYNGASWESVGNKGFSDGLADSLSFEIDANNTLYIGYRDHSFLRKPVVMKNIGISWEPVGEKGFSGSEICDISLDIDNNNVPIAAYIDGNNGAKATVMKYNSVSWEPVGIKGFSDSVAVFISLEINNNTPFLAFADAAVDYRSTVMKYNGASWEPVGEKGFTDGKAEIINLILDKNNMPLIAFKDEAQSGKATVMKFNGTMWEPVGKKGFSKSDVNSISFAISKNDIPYVALSDGTVMRYR